ncbi:MAG TPA: hypothetical protein VIH40_09380 [Xanthobacteraceae bacterium]
MPRILATPRRNSLEASATGAVDLILLRIAGPGIHDPIGVCNDVVNFAHEGVIYFGLAAELMLLSDADQPPRASCRLANVDGVIGRFVRTLTASPRLRLQLACADDWHAALTDSGEVDAGGEAILARQPIATPAIDYEADWLRIASARIDALSVDCDLASFDLTAEPWPAARATPDRLPALFR